MGEKKNKKKKFKKYLKQLNNTMGKQHVSFGKVNLSKKKKQCHQIRSKKLINRKDRSVLRWNLMKDKNGIL